MSVKNYQKFYEPLNAVHSADFHRCIYCGCEAARPDFIPPIKFIHDWRDVNSSADFICVPSCNECFDLLKNENSGTLEPRITVLKKLLAAKYEKAIRVFNHWSMDEIEEMDTAFQISLKGGMRLGKETLSRLQFAGFDYEVNGSITRVAKPQCEVFKVFDEEFESFREALAFASKTYQIKKSRLSQLYFEHDESFDKAVEVFHGLGKNQ
ncbi:hypothetical protein A6K25_04220 [Alteromonas stellipolaris]|uniref:hypothetical protein n=1 Tax=Alteromonas stellipolaris TaxID=233316 RepID=UPI0007B438C3|nr:hypothetical protein [Alteromonas stellipolaris]ANB20560.1 hypothetical protein A6K25_04220 [Alteromonas stellipolaris]